MIYTVKQLSQFAGISVRTLHYYDEIGLLEPSFIKDNSYRCYEEKELVKLQQILFFRELEFSLEEILNMMQAPDFNPVVALEDQRRLLKLKRSRMTDLIRTIDKTIANLKGGETMTNDDLFKAISDDHMDKYKEEAKQRWGHTDAYKQSVQRTKHWTKADYKRIQDAGNALAQELAAAMEQDLTITSPEVQSLVVRHYKGIETFYDCSMEMYRGLAKMYVEDARFTAFYDQFRPGLAVWLQEAINYFCDQEEKKF